jgi:hypothetical protein
MCELRRGTRASRVLMGNRNLNSGIWIQERFAARFCDAAAGIFFSGGEAVYGYIWRRAW